jgi:hypothetical protein
MIDLKNSTFNYNSVLKMVPPIRRIEISQPSVMSLYIEMFFNDLLLGSGTGFLCKGKSGNSYLITNRHNVTGRHQETAKCLDEKTCSIPNLLKITHNKTGSLGKTIVTKEPLYNLDDNPLWVEHPHLNEKADFVAVPLTQLNQVNLIFYELQGQPDIKIRVSDVISVVGFPFGKKIEGTAVWATGFIASEPDINYENLPVFLIDCRSRKGQSGSAVIAHRNDGTYSDSHGNQILAGKVATKFLGIYSGRINDESDLGMVWKSSAIAELLQSI